MGLLLGFDLGSSSIKATLMDAQTGAVLAGATCPERELEIIAEKPGWAEQHPSTWWSNIISATQQIKSKAKFDPADIQAIGISYQMHGLVLVDKNHKVLRPAIIWCDSRAVEIGRQGAVEMGQEKCLKSLLNLPGNFTASKLKWVMDNEPQVYSQIHKMMLPGDYAVMRMTGKISTTTSGLSEGIMWDYQQEELSKMLLEYYGINRELIAEVVPNMGVQGELCKKAADELGLKAGTKITYRAGDQPNNALSLKILNPGEIAATAGTSGVVCVISDKANYDDKSRVNTFVHVNHTEAKPRYATLLCVNGAGILNSWLKHNFGGLEYEQMNEMAGEVPIGSEGLSILPYGNGAERVLENENVGASVHGWNFNVHNKAHFLRAGQEGIAFALNFGLDVIRQMGTRLGTVRAGNANMFLSPLFGQAFAAITGSIVELYNTDGSAGAARGAGIGADTYQNVEDAFVGLKAVKTIEPDEKLSALYDKAYKRWADVLKHQLKMNQ